MAEEEAALRAKCLALEAEYKQVLARVNALDAAAATSATTPAGAATGGGPLRAAAAHVGAAAAVDGHHSRPIPSVDPRDYQAVFDIISVRPPCGPLKLHFTTTERVSAVAQQLDLALMMYRLIEVPSADMTVQDAVAHINLEQLMHTPDSQITYASHKLLRIMQFSSIDVLNSKMSIMWRHNISFRNEWQGIVRNLMAGRLHAIRTRGVIFHEDVKPNTLTAITMYPMAEVDPVTGKTYITAVRHVENPSITDPRLTNGALRDLMAVKYR